MEFGNQLWSKYVCLQKRVYFSELADVCIKDEIRRGEAVVKVDGVCDYFIVWTICNVRHDLNDLLYFLFLTRAAAFSKPQANKQLTRSRNKVSTKNIMRILDLRVT